MIERIVREQRRGVVVGVALGALLVLGDRVGTGATDRMVDLARTLWRQVV